MSKDTILSLVRSIATLIGSFLVGRVLLGVPVDWTIVLGGLIAIGSTVWGILDKSLSSEAAISGLKSAVLAVGGVFVAAGKLSGQTLDAVLGFLIALTTIIQGFAQKATVQQVAAGTAVPEIKKGTEPANVPTVFTGKLIKQTPAVPDPRAKTDPDVK